MTESDQLETTLDSLGFVGAGERVVVGTYGPNMGNPTISARFSVAELARMSVVANGLDSPDGDEIAQRPLDPAHATKLAQFILKGLVNCAVQRHLRQSTAAPSSLLAFAHQLSTQPYFSLPPIIASLRDAGYAGRHLRATAILDERTGEQVAIRFWMRQDQLLYIIDGQHRRKAIELVMDFFEQEVLQRRRYAKKGLYDSATLAMTADEVKSWSDVYHAARTDALVSVEIHLGLTVDQERQLFHDTNNLGKKVAPSLALAFDQANPINQFIKLELSSHFSIVDRDVTVVDWSKDSGAMSRKDLVAVNAHLFLNRTNAKGASQAEITAREHHAKRFWDSVTTIDGLGQTGARARTVAAQPVVLKALAKLMYDFAFGRTADEQLRDRLLARISTIDFSHQNRAWDFFVLSDAEREEAGLASLAQFLPSIDDGVNRDIGARDSEGRMRFGSKHNDILPILGDIIRWQMELPNRHTK